MTTIHSSQRRAASLSARPLLLALDHVAQWLKVGLAVPTGCPWASCLSSCVKWAVGREGHEMSGPWLAHLGCRFGHWRRWSSAPCGQCVSRL